MCEPTDSTLHPEAGAIVDNYRKIIRAMDCHVDVVDGCPGGDIDGCLDVCPGVPDAPPPLELQCRETCAEACGVAVPKAERKQIARANGSGAHPSAGQKRRQPLPPYWGDSHQVVMSRNSTNADGTDEGFRACMRWYDWTQFGARNDCTRDGATSTTLTVRGRLCKSSHAAARSPY